MATKSVTVKLSQVSESGGVNLTYGLWAAQPNPASPNGGSSGIYDNDIWWAFFRFAMPERIPDVASNISASLSLRVYDSAPGLFLDNGDRLFVWIQSQENPHVPANINERPNGSASANVPIFPAWPSTGVRWPASGGLVPPVWAAGNRVTSPNISTLIQHRLTNYGTIEQGDIICLWLAQNAFGGNTFGLYGFYTAAQGDQNLTPWLTVQWDEPDPPPAPPAGEDISIFRLRVLRRLP